MKAKIDPCENCDLILNCKDCPVFRKLHKSYMDKQKAISDPNLCCMCHNNYVDSSSGFDTCDSCIRNI